jgi:hypothetical protein
LFTHKISYKTIFSPILQEQIVIPFQVLTEFYFSFILVQPLVCSPPEMKYIENGIDKSVHCNDVKSLDIIIDAGVTLEDRLVLESAALQLAYAYDGMRLQLIYTGNKNSVDKYRKGIKNVFSFE